MRVTVYDRNPGKGFFQWFLKTSWVVGCWIQKLFGAVDAVYGASSWEDALRWLKDRHDPLTHIQFWGHGSPGTLWNGGIPTHEETFLVLKPMLVPETVLWFRACSVFQGQRGHDFSKRLADGLGCTIAGHTRVIGVFQGGLHTRKPHTEPSWPVTEGELRPEWLNRLGLRWGNNTVICLATKVPADW